MCVCVVCVCVRPPLTAASTCCLPARVCVCMRACVGGCRYDCVTLADFLESIRTSNQLQRSPSLWLLSDAAQDMFTACTNRLRRIVRVASPAKVPRGCVHAQDVAGALLRCVVLCVAVRPGVICRVD